MTKFIAAISAYKEKDKKLNGAAPPYLMVFDSAMDFLKLYESDKHSCFHQLFTIKDIEKSKNGSVLLNNLILGDDYNHREVTTRMLYFGGRHWRISVEHENKHLPEIAAALNNLL